MSKEPQIRPCAYCGEPLPYPYPKRRYHPECRELRNRLIGTVYEWEYKKSFAAYKISLGCSKCGYNKCAASLDFHHKDPSTKDKAIGNFCKVFHTPAAQKELAKCVLLCRNCHNEEHWGDVNTLGFSVYLAARYSRQQELKKYALELRRVGITVTSYWLEEPSPANAKLSDFSDEENCAMAEKDLANIREADALVLFTEDPMVPVVRGGRHVELGYAYALGKKVMTVGPRENIFHFLEDMPNFRDWKYAKIFLIREYVSKRRANARYPEWIN